MSAYSRGHPWQSRRAAEPDLAAAANASDDFHKEVNPDGAGLDCLCCGQFIATQSSNVTSPFQRMHDSIAMRIGMTMAADAEELHTATLWPA